MKKKCPICGTEFETRTAKKYCSEACQRAGRVKTQQEYGKKRTQGFRRHMDAISQCDSAIKIFGTWLEHAKSELNQCNAAIKYFTKCREKLTAEV